MLMEWQSEAGMQQVRQMYLTIAAPQQLNGATINLETFQPDDFYYSPLVKPGNTLF